MLDQITSSLSWGGIVIGILAVILLLEVLFRGLFTTFGTPAHNTNPHRTGTELPRVLKR